LFDHCLSFLVIVKIERNYLLLPTRGKFKFTANWSPAFRDWLRELDWEYPLAREMFKSYLKQA